MKYLYVLYCFLLIFGINGCNVCDADSEKLIEHIPPEVLFMSQSLSGENNSLYGINTDGTGLEMLFDNLIDYSGASRDDKILIAHKEDLNVIFTEFNMINHTSRGIMFDHIFQDIRNLELSESGNYAAFISDDKVWIADLNSLEVRSLTYTVLKSERPVFSPVDDILAILQPNQLVIYDCNNQSGREIQLNVFALYPQNEPLKASFSSNGRNIYYSDALMQLQDYSLDNGTFSVLAKIDYLFYIPEISPSGYFVFTDVDGNIRKYLSNDDKLIFSSKPDENCSNIEFIYNDKLCFFLHNNSGGLSGLYFLDIKSQTTKYLFSNVISYRRY